MANLTITLKTQAMNVFGPSPSTKWQLFNWGTGTWGQKAAGTAGTPQIIKNIGKLTSAQVMTPSDSLFFSTIKVLQTQVVSFATQDTTTSEQLKDGSIYTYVFPGPVAEGENRPIPAYITATAGVSGWAAIASSGTTWS